MRQHSEVRRGQRHTCRAQRWRASKAPSQLERIWNSEEQFPGGERGSATKPETLFDVRGFPNKGCNSDAECAFAPRGRSGIPLRASSYCRTTREKCLELA